MNKEQKLSSSPQFEFVHHTMPNGLQVVISPDRIAPVAAVNLWYDVGSRHERYGRTGFAHLFEHLMFEGSTNVKSGEHMRVVQEYGGSVNGTTSSDRTVYTETVAVEQLELMLHLEADRMGGLLDAVTQESLDKQRDVVRNERRQRYDDQPYGTAHERLYALLFPEGHPYHHLPIGSMEDLAAAALEDVHEFFRSFYAPDNAILSIVGDVDPDAAIELVSRHFDHIPPCAAIPDAPDAKLETPLEAPVRVEMKEKVPASAIFMGYRLPTGGEPAFDPLMLAFGVMSAGRSSTLHRKLVRAELAQQAAASIDSRVVGASVGSMIGLARQGVSVSQIEEVFQGEIARLAESGPTPVELLRAKAMIERQWLDGLSSLEGRAAALSQETAFFGDPGRINDHLRRINEPGAEDVRAAVKQYLFEQHPAVVEYAPLVEEVAA